LLNNLLGGFAINFVKPITQIVKNKERLNYILATREVKSYKVINEDNTIISYVPVIDKQICESQNLNYQKVIFNESNKNIMENIYLFQETSIIISAFNTA